MKRNKITSDFGTRQESIKIATLLKKIESKKKIATIICVIKQHQESVDQILDASSIKSSYNLNIMEQKKPLWNITTGTLNGLEKDIKYGNPSMVLNYDDTTTILAGAIISFYNQITIERVEADRTAYDKYALFLKEEMNRKIIDGLTKIKDDLLKESKNENKIYITRNTVIDAIKKITLILNWVG